MSEPLKTPPVRLLLMLAVLSSRTAVTAANPEVQSALRSAQRLRNLLAAVLLLSCLHAIWATFITGTELPLQPVALRGGVEKEKVSAVLHLTPDMNPVQLRFQRRTDPRHSLDYRFAVRDAAGRIIATEFTGDYGVKDPPTGSDLRTSQMGLFEVSTAGDYVVEIEVEQRDAPTAIQDAAVGVRRDAAESYFLLTLLLSPFAAWLAAKWWLRRYARVWDALATGGEPEPTPHDDAPPLFPARSRLRLRQALAPATSTDEPPPAPAPAMGATATVEEESLFARIQTRVVFEGWSLLLTAAQVPLVGAYTMLGLIVVLGALGGTSPASMDALMQSPITARVAQWFFPEGRYEGFAVLWAMGQAGGVLVIGFHLLMLPLRLLRSRSQRWSYGRKLKLLIQASVVGALVAGVVFYLPKQEFDQAIKGLTVYGLLLAFLFVPAAVLLAITTKLQEMMDAVYPPDEPPAG